MVWEWYSNNAPEEEMKEFFEEWRDLFLIGIVCLGISLIFPIFKLYLKLSDDKQI